MEALVGAAAGLLGTMLGALLTWLITTRQRRLATTFDMHREFNSPEMIRSRYKASELLEAHSDENLAELRQRLGRVEMQGVWNVVNFYQRLWLPVRYGSLRNEYVPGLFGDISIGGTREAFVLNTFLYIQQYQKT
jgi:hypothetical protein